MKTPSGWFWSDTFHHWQKRNKEIYCYVSPIMGGHKAQLYITGTAAMCELEVQTFNNDMVSLAKIFVIAEEWLHKYSDGDLNNIHQDKYSISNPNGVWVKDHYKKEWRI